MKSVNNRDVKRSQVNLREAPSRVIVLPNQTNYRTAFKNVFAYTKNMKTQNIGQIKPLLTVEIHNY